jgi:hypothetical protein
MRETDPNDPKGLIRESFRIEGITASECRSIFVDWALSLAADDTGPSIKALLETYAAEPADHPMKTVLNDGLNTPPAARRRGGRAAAVARRGSET